jgi:hypothetical protein
MGDFKDKTRGGKDKDDYSDPDPNATGRSGKEAYKQDDVASGGDDDLEHVADAGGGGDFANAGEEGDPPDPKRRSKKS